MKNLSNEQLHSMVEEYLKKHPCAMFEEVQDHVLKQTRTWVEQEIEDVYWDLKEYLGPDTLAKISQSVETKTLEEIKEWINATLEKAPDPEDIIVFEFSNSKTGLVCIKYGTFKKIRPWFYYQGDWPSKSFDLFEEKSDVKNFSSVGVSTVTKRPTEDEEWGFLSLGYLEKLIEAKKGFNNRQYQVKMKIF